MLTFASFPNFTSVNQVPVNRVPSRCGHSASDELHGAAPLGAGPRHWDKLLQVLTVLHRRHTTTWALHYFHTLVYMSIDSHTAAVDRRLGPRLLGRYLLVFVRAVTPLQLGRVRWVPWTDRRRAPALHAALLVAALVVTRLVLRLLVRQAHLGGGGGHGSAVDQNHVDSTTSEPHQVFPRNAALWRVYRPVQRACPTTNGYENRNKLYCNYFFNFQRKYKRHVKHFASSSTRGNFTQSSVADGAAICYNPTKFETTPR